MSLLKTCKQFLQKCYTFANCSVRSVYFLREAKTVFMKLKRFGVWMIFVKELSAPEKCAGGLD